MGTTTKRDTQMALLTIVATILVVAGHCDITPDYKQLWIFKWVYSFHMPLFFFISGYLFCLTNPKDRLLKTTLKTFLNKKLVRLMLPFIVIDTIIFIIKATIFSDGELVQHPIELSLDSYLYRVFIQPIGFMWFLPALFMIFIIVFPTWKHLKTSNANPTILAIISILIFIFAYISTTYFYEFSLMQISKALYYLAFFWGGILYCEYSEYINNLLKKYWIPILLCSAAISLLFLGSKLLRIIAGIVLMVEIAYLISDYIPKQILDMGAFTYNIFLLSYFPQMLVRGPISHMFPNINQYWFSALSFILGLGIPIIFCLSYNKIQLRLPWLKKYRNVFGI